MLKSQVFLFVVVACCTAASLQSFSPIWPVSGSLAPDLPQSSPYGPRRKAAEGYRYDWHRGVDIPCPLGTPLHAIANGSVKLSGEYPGIYSDMVVQIKHVLDDTTLYANYLHMQSVVFSEHDIVQKGDIIGYSGASNNGFAHVHFEIRKNGVFQKDCINPWTVMPYSSNFYPTLTAEVVWMDILDSSPISALEGAGEIYNVTVEVWVSTPAQQLTFNSVWLQYDENGGAVPFHTVDFQELTLEFTAGGIAILDDPRIPSQNAVVSPHRFNSWSTCLAAEWNVTFLNVYVNRTAFSCSQLLAVAQDVEGRTVSVPVALPLPACPVAIPTPSPLDVVSRAACGRRDDPAHGWFRILASVVLLTYFAVL